jgi:hypothetical protein
MKRKEGEKNLINSSTQEASVKDLNQKAQPPAKSKQEMISYYNYTSLHLIAARRPKKSLILNHFFLSIF